MIKVEATNIEWDAPKSSSDNLPSLFVFHLDKKEDIDYDDEEDIQEWVSDMLSDEIGYCHFGFCYQQSQ